MLFHSTALILCIPSLELLLCCFPVDLCTFAFRLSFSFACIASNGHSTLTLPILRILLADEYHPFIILSETVSRRLLALAEVRLEIKSEGGSHSVRTRYAKLSSAPRIDNSSENRSILSAGIIGRRASFASRVGCLVKVSELGAVFNRNAQHLVECSGITSSNWSKRATSAAPLSPAASRVKNRY